MAMAELYNQKKVVSITSDQLRERTLELSKDFKTSWIQLGQTLYSIWRDKTYHDWGYEKFEDYVLRELSLKKQMALKLVKTYYFVEQEEPVYLNKDFVDGRQTHLVPGYEALDVLRLARTKKELTKADYAQLRKAAFEKGVEGSMLRKDLTALIKERKVVDPNEEKERQALNSLRRCLTAVRSFKKDMETMKWLPQEVLEKAEEFIERLEQEAE